jgi:hypothetical protein
MRRHLNSCSKTFPVALLAIVLLTGALLGTGRPRAQEPTPPKPTEVRRNVEPPVEAIVPSPPPPRTPKPGDRPRPITREDLEAPLQLAIRVYEDINQRCSKGEMIDLESAFAWSRRILEYEREVGGANSDRLNPYGGHLMRMRDILHHYNNRVIAGRLPETSIEMMKANFYYRDAVNSLLRAGGKIVTSPERNK